MSRDHDIAATLIDIEAELRGIGHWDRQSPPPEALRSEQPFAVDTLAFNQWLQFIFIPRMRFLLEQQQALPGACSIAPMAEEFYRGQNLPVAELLDALRRIDALLDGRDT
ncbi:YqcC family protein [Spongiibacter sp.]|uniref:YqcC family protein n=1 Tax=Spongiibacter sp. TaxID=2024860 RepID=UPI003564DEC6